MRSAEDLSDSGSGSDATERWIADAFEVRVSPACLVRNNTNQRSGYDTPGSERDPESPS